MIHFILSYLIGSISFAIIVSKLFKLSDPRSYGSKNPGATNVLRSGNKIAAFLTFLLDFLKGLIVVLYIQYLCKHSPHRETLVAINAILVVLGHMYPIFFRFRGGKGVATAIGVIFCFNIFIAFLVLATWIIILLLSKKSSLAAIISAALAPIYAFLIMGNNSYFGAILIIVFFVIYRHKANIYRLINGQEK